MRHHIALFALGIMFSISACDKPPERPTPPISTTDQQKINSSLVLGSDTGVPSAASVFPDATATQPIPPTGRPSGALTPAQEMSGMPIPGQNNDHSAPLATAKPASSPR